MNDLWKICHDESDDSHPAVSYLSVSLPFSEYIPTESDASLLKLLNLHWQLPSYQEEL